jgi:CheY-like chemotaxis protein
MNACRVRCRCDTPSVLALIFSSARRASNLVRQAVAPKKILIADDSRTFRQLEEELLKRRYTLLQAENGAQAIQLAVQELPDIILLDLQMPVMDGAKVLALLKSNQATSAIPVVLITTIANNEQVEQLLKAGAARFVAKPIQGPDLLGAIRDLIGD